MAKLIIPKMTDEEIREGWGGVVNVISYRHVADAATAKAVARFKSWLWELSEEAAERSEEGRMDDTSSIIRQVAYRVGDAETGIESRLE